jgi:hypothetical protein
MSAGAFRILRRRNLRAAVYPPRVSLTSAPHPIALPARAFAVIRKEKVMSKTCGDTARFHRIRKQKINRRAKNRLLQAEIAARKAEKAAKPAA